MSANFEASLPGTSSQAKVESPGRPALMRGIAEQSGRVAEEVQELGRVAVATAGQAAANLRGKSKRALDAAVSGARKATGQLDELVGNHPWKSVLIALGVGAVIGFALRRRS